MKLLRANTSLCKLYIQICLDNANPNAETALTISRTIKAVAGEREGVGGLDELSSDFDLMLNTAGCRAREKHMDARNTMLEHAAPNAHDIMLMR